MGLGRILREPRLGQNGGRRICYYEGYVNGIPQSTSDQSNHRKVNHGERIGPVHKEQEIEIGGWAVEEKSRLQIKAALEVRFPESTTALSGTTR